MRMMVMLSLFIAFSGNARAEEQRPKLIITPDGNIVLSNDSIKNGLGNDLLLAKKFGEIGFKPYEVETTTGKKTLVWGEEGITKASNVGTKAKELGFEFTQLSDEQLAQYEYVGFFKSSGSSTTETFFVNLGNSVFERAIDVACSQQVAPKTISAGGQFEVDGVVAAGNISFSMEWERDELCSN